MDGDAKETALAFWNRFLDCPDLTTVSGGDEEADSLEASALMHDRQVPVRSRDAYSDGIGVTAAGAEHEVKSLETPSIHDVQLRNPLLARARQCPPKTMSKRHSHGISSKVAKVGNSATSRTGLQMLRNNVSGSAREGRQAAN